MRHLTLRVAASLFVAGLFGAAAPGVRAETQTENIVAEARIYLFLQVAADAAQAFLPAGWTVSPATTGPNKDANLIALFIDRKMALTPDGKPLGVGINRLLVVLVPGKSAKTGEVANVIVGGYSADPSGSPGAYKVYGTGSVNVDRVERSNGKLESAVEETWAVKGQDASVDLHIAFVRGVPVMGTFEQRNHSAADPEFYRIYRGEQAADLVKSVNTGVNRVQSIQLKASGSSKLAKAINGSEKIIAVTSMPFYRRNTFLP